MKDKVVDLFCGAGGFSKGFEMSNKFEIIKGYDINEEALKTFNKNHDAEGEKYDIRDKVPEELKNSDIEVVIGSPPCQGFSDAKGSRNVEDERNNLVFRFIHWINKIKPKVVVMENVTGILTIDDAAFVEEVKKRYEKAGYGNVVSSKFNSKYFGVPQSRERAVFIATRSDMPDPPSQFKMENLELENEICDYVTVGEAISDLPAPNEDGIIEAGDYKKDKPQNKFQKIMRENSEITYNHVAKEPKEKDLFIVKNIPEGKMYRSTRFGKKYIGVWDLFEEKFNLKERLILWFIARHRGRKEYKVTDKSGPDYIAGEKIVNSLKEEDVLKEATDHGFEDLINEEINVTIKNVEKLEKNGWLRTKKSNGKVAYDLNSKSGVRPRYIRLSRKEQSNTILTTDFNAREKLHPIENRGLSLREGARIQSFPDEFEFKGDFDSIASQIGNAVPPLMAQGIANYVSSFLGIKKNKAI